jgi:hypothetical protein
MRDLLNPMTDLVERLRNMSNDMIGPYVPLTLEAAAEIERLRAELKGATNHVHRAQAAARKANGNA